MSPSYLTSQLAQRFVDVNGCHDMTESDDAYVSECYVALGEVAVEAGIDADEIRTWMLQGLLPLPSYLRSDGVEMVPRDLLELANIAGGPDQLPGWFAAQWPDADDARDAWEDYLSGQLVCLRNVTPADMQRKVALSTAIERLLEEPQPASDRWLADLHHAVDDLDRLEAPFTAYDRLRFGGPVSRDRLIDDVRARFPAPRSAGVTATG